MSEHVYSDGQMLMATQVAYMDVPEGMTVGEYADYVISTVEAAGGKDNVNAKLRAQYDTVTGMTKLSENTGCTDWKNWTVVDSCDHNNGSGLYGCLISTGDGNAIVGFRGSESFDTMQSIKDWGVADVGMLNSQLTQQQLEASEYTRRIWEKYGSRYNSFSFTGHSLGGNLAEHATITAPAAMRGRIDHTISFDGPGYSQEYLADHLLDIKASKDKISHYAWSWVGAIMTQPGSIDDRVIYADQAKRKDDPTYKVFGIDTGVKESLLWTHHPNNVHFENGNVVNMTEDIIKEDESVRENLAFMQLSHNITVTADRDSTTMLMYMIPIVGPIYAGIDTYNRISSARRSGREHMERSFNDFKDLINSILNNIYRQTHLPTVSGNFEINVPRAHAIGNDIDNMGRQTREIIGEIERIQRSLKFDSLSGAYYKSQLWFMCNRLSRDALGLDKAAAAIQTCSITYSRADAAVSEGYI